MMLTVVVINGTFGDESNDGKFLYIVQSELERSGFGLTEVSDDRKLLPVTDAELTKQDVQLKDQFSVTDKKNNTVAVNLSLNADMYTAENVLDHIVVITNTGNHIGYVRTWFAFEMGDLTEDEFEEYVLLNRNFIQWTWGEFTYGVQIDGERYAVICAEYKNVLEGGATTSPNLLQILLSRDATNDISSRLEGNNDSKYEVRAYSQIVSDKGAWSQVTDEPWNKPQSAD